MSIVKKHKNTQHQQGVAYHVDWGFSEESIVWDGGKPVVINFYPIATELRNWLLRKGRLSLLSQTEKELPVSIKNPYSYSASSIAAIFANSLNAGHKFTSSTEDIDDMDAEIERIRLYNEQVLYTSRICEVTIKQLLHCTLIPRRLYKKAALGGLLSTDCKPCRKAGSPHAISLLGSLAHRYHLCLPFEHCLVEHLKIVKRRRDIEAAHSDTQIINVRTSQTSREQLKTDSVEAANELVHMLSHISELEQKMFQELEVLSSLPYKEWSE